MHFTGAGTVGHLLCIAQWGRKMSALEQMIRTLIRRKNAAPEGSAERRMYERELTGLRYTYKDAGPIMEDLDPTEWDGPVRPLQTSPATEPRQILHPLRKAGSPRE
jgi:hypothetical protein